MGEKKEDIYVPEGSDKFFSLYLGEPGFGTLVYDERSMKGLALGLKVNGLAKKVQDVFIVGGAIPYIPPYTSKGKGLTDYQNILGKIKRAPGEGPSMSDKLLQERLETEYEKGYFEKYISNEEERKIESLEDAFRVTENQLKILGKVLSPNTPIRIKAGEEDIKNIMDIRMTKIKKANEIKVEQLKRLYNEYNFELKKNKEGLMDSHINKYCFDKIITDKNLQKQNEKIEDYQNKLKKKFRVPMSKIIQSYYKDINGDKRSKIIDETIKKISWVESRDSISTKEYYEKYEENFNKLKEEKKTIESKFKSIDRNINWWEILNSRKSISGFINQIPITPGESQLYWASAKEEYSKMFGGIKLAQPLYFHVTGRKNVDTGKDTIVDPKTGKKTDMKRENVTTQGKTISLIHNIKEISSNATGARGLKVAKDLMHRYNILSNKFEEGKENPDIMLTSHDGGGFRVQPWFKKTEKDLDGVFVSGQDISYLISLPTLQSMKSLDWAVAHNISTDHTKRYEQGPWGSAAIMHTEGELGQNRFKVWENEDLIEWGKAYEAIEVYKEGLKDKKITKESKKDLKKLILENENKAKITMKKMETSGDIHGGCASNKYRHSVDQLLEAMQEYQLRTGLPSIAVWDETFHGVQTRYGAAADYRADIPPIFKKKMENLEKRDDINWQRKFDLLAKESLNNQRAIPIFNSSKQLENSNYTLVQYGMKILENGGKVAVASGNHNNKSRPFSDEAIEFCLQFPLEMRESGLVIPIDGLANDVGAGHIDLKDGKMLYVSHKFQRGQDEVYGIMSHLRKMNNDADIVFGGDAHQSGAGYADGHLVTLHPGFQAQNKFVQTAAAKPAGVRGFINVFYDPTKKGIYETEFVVNNTLEKIIEEKNIR